LGWFGSAAGAAGAGAQGGSSKALPAQEHQATAHAARPANNGPGRLAARRSCARHASHAFSFSFEKPQLLINPDGDELRPCRKHQTGVQFFDGVRFTWNKIKTYWPSLCLATVSKLRMPIFLLLNGPPAA